jgi:hypothetical protein
MEVHTVEAPVSGCDAKKFSQRLKNCAFAAPIFPDERCETVEYHDHRVGAETPKIPKRN